MDKLAAKATIVGEASGSEVRRKEPQVLVSKLARRADALVEHVWQLVELAQLTECSAKQ